MDQNKILEIIEILDNINRLKEELDKGVGKDFDRDLEILDEIQFDIAFVKDLINDGRK